MLNGLDASYCYLIVLFVSLSVAELSTIPILTHTLYECGSYCIIFGFEKKEIEIESKKLRLRLRSNPLKSCPNRGTITFKFLKNLF